MEACIRADRCERVYGLVRQERQIHTQEREAIGRFLEAVFRGNRSGARWRFLPAGYGAWNGVYTRFARWDDLGVWERLFAQVADDPDRQRVLVDATVIRAHACAAGAPQTTASRRRRRAGGRAGAAARSATSWSTRWATR